MFANIVGSRALSTQLTSGALFNGVRQQLSLCKRTQEPRVEVPSEVQQSSRSTPWSVRMSLQRLALAFFLLTGWTVGMCAGATPYFASLPVGEWVDIPNSALGLSPLFGPYPPETCVNGIEG